MTNLPTVHRFDGKFLELPREHVHAYIIELPRSVVIVDTTLALSSARELRAKAAALGKPISAVLLTHGHPDHYSGLAVFADVPRYCSAGVLAFVRQQDAIKHEMLAELLAGDYPTRRVFPDRIVGDGEVVSIDGVDFTFTDLGPGESGSDGMWTFVADGTRHVFLGDVVANRVHCYFRDNQPLAWLRSLDRLERELPAETRLYIGHGETPTTTETIAWQRGYITTFMDAVARLPDRTLPVGEATQDQIVATMQAYLPGDTLLFLLRFELGEAIADFFQYAPPGAAEANPAAAGGDAPSEAAVRDLVDVWFTCLDVHAPVDQLRAMLADDGLEMRFPEATLRGQAEFEQWYDGVIRKYFDETHTLTTVNIRRDGPEAVATIVVRWEASAWNPPAATSQRLAFDAAQTWRLRRVPDTGNIVITSYTVDALTPVAESAAP